MIPQIASNEFSMRLGHAGVYLVMTEIILDHFKERLTTQTSAPSEEHVHVQLEKILKSRSFVRCPRLQRFLRYAVEITLRGDQRLKEYTLGVDVFDRDHTFDPRMDSIVRVEALRARKKLAGYYAGEGCQDEVLISLTKGNYRARFALAPKPDHVLNGDRSKSFGRGSIRFWESTGPAGTTDWVERGAGECQTFPRFFDSIHIEDHGKVRSAILESFRTGVDLSVNFRMAPQRETVQHAHAHGILAAGQDDHPGRMLGICIGIGWPELPDAEM